MKVGSSSCRASSVSAAGTDGAGAEAGRPAAIARCCLRERRDDCTADRHTQTPVSKQTDKQPGQTTDTQTNTGQSTDTQTLVSKQTHKHTPVSQQTHKHRSVNRHTNTGQQTDRHTNTSQPTDTGQPTTTPRHRSANRHTDRSANDNINTPVRKQTHKHTYAYIDQIYTGQQTDKHTGWSL